MQQVLFKRAQALVQDQWFIGHYSWSHSMRVASGSATCSAGSESSTVSLYVNGVDSGAYFSISSGTTVATLTIPSSIYVATGAEVRFKITSGPTNAGVAAFNAAIVLNVEAQESSESALPADAFRVKYSNGSELVTIYDYDSALGIFSEPSAGVSLNRATINTNGNASLTVTISGVGNIFLVTQSGVVQSPCFVENPSVSLGESYPRLLWQINGHNVAIMSQEGIKVTGLTEEGVSLNLGAFSLYGGGAIMATIGMAGLSCQSGLEEL